MNSVCVELNPKNCLNEKEKFIPKKAFSNNFCPPKFNIDSHPSTAIEEPQNNKDETDSHRFKMKLNQKTNKIIEKDIHPSNLCSKRKQSCQTQEIEDKQAQIRSNVQANKNHKEKMFNKKHIKS